MKYNEFNLGQIEAVFNKLGGVYGVKRFLSGQTEVRAIPKSFLWWKKVTIGKFNSIGEVWRALTEKGVELKEGIPYGSKKCALRHRSVTMLNSPLFTLAKVEEEIELVSVKLKDLGFVDSGFVPKKEVLKWASQIGLEPCPAEVVIDLLLNHQLEETRRKDVQIVMEPIRVADDHLNFRLREDGGCGALLLDWDVSDKFSDFECYVFRLVNK